MGAIAKTRVKKFEGRGRSRRKKKIEKTPKT
jgi:hypothetical protein